MTQLLTIPQSSPKSAVQTTWPFYLALGITINAAIWGLALLYIKVKSPSYTSDFSISLPVTGGPATNVNVPGIGQATSQSESPYQNASLDPRENYKFLLTSKPVLEAAAKQVNMPLSEFNQPRITIVANTTIMKVELAGRTPEEARSKTRALHQALEKKLQDLRYQQVFQQDKVLQETLSSSQQKLKLAQQRLSDYKAKSILSSRDQISNLTNNIEQLRKQRAEILAQQQEAHARMTELSTNLNISAQQAGDAFILQTDPVFQKLLQGYSEASNTLMSLNAKFLPDHPAVIDEKASLNAGETAMLNRARSILGRSVSLETLKQLNLSNTGSSSSARTALSQELVTAKVQEEGFKSQAQALDRQIALLETRLRTMAQQESTLDDLQREVQTAEAVFSSTLTRLDLGKSSISASYPQIQIFTEPNLPKSATEPKKQFIIMGAALASVFCTNGLVLLWLRQRKRLLSKRVDSVPSETTQIRTTIPEVLELATNGNSNNGKRG